MRTGKCWVGSCRWMTQGQKPTTSRPQPHLHAHVHTRVRKGGGLQLHPCAWRCPASYGLRVVFVLCMRTVHTGSPACAPPLWSAPQTWAAARARMPCGHSIRGTQHAGRGWSRYQACSSSSACATLGRGGGALPLMAFKAWEACYGGCHTI